MRRFLRAAAAIFLSVSLMTMGAAAFTVEQTQICMPDLDVYLYEDGSDFTGLTERDVAASLGGESLSCEAFGRSEEGIYYVYMLDVSASMPDDLFAAAKAAVSDACGRLREQDTLTLITFGNDVRLILSGSESIAGARAAIEALTNTDQHTKFYTAMGALVKQVAGTEDMRRVAVVFSDGIDSTDAGMTQEELEETLLSAGVSVSGMCIDSSTADVEGFEKLITMSGGELYTFGAENAAEVLTSLLGRLEGGWHIKLTAANNIASGKPTPLVLTVGSDRAELTVTPENWTPDDRAPRVENAGYDRGTNTITVTFSEPVAGGEELSAYTLMTGGGEELAISGAESADGVVFTLTPAAPLPEEGAVVLTVAGLRDLSMESNEMYKYTKELISGGTEAAQTSAPTEESAQPVISTVTIVIVGAAVLAAAAAAFVILKLAGKKPEDKEKAKESRKPRSRRDRPENVKNTATFMFLGKEQEDKKDR